MLIDDDEEEADAMPLFSSKAFQGETKEALTLQLAAAAESEELTNQQEFNTGKDSQTYHHQ